MTRDAAIPSALLGPLLLASAIALLAPTGGRMPGLSLDDIAAIESAVGGTVPPALRAYLLDPPPDAARLVEGDGICEPTVDGVIGATQALHETARGFEISIPRGSIGLAGNSCGDFWFLHPEHDDAVWIALHESASIEEECPSLRHHLESVRASIAWGDLADAVRSDAPPALVAGLGFAEPDDSDDGWTFYTPYGRSETEFVDVSALLDDSNVPVMPVHLRAMFTPPEQWDDEVVAYRRREEVLLASSTLLERVLAFDDDGLPTNLAAARTRALQYIRSRLDPSFVVDPPFTAAEVADLP